ncbi:putative 2,3-diketo-5-methylthio-1-phosphopentane phosphatase [Oesophagostomum dentatum]|uniref:Putative 2,3-diketo-5-methylthio-1-phosphopentane phosphatase n=1 Tax=Oesophagostomum dentatum TaxID=61180 RepID=A0A0B1TBN0_OESDE|nr:putative 2,3-diketo-5-methylthio-1-phosphopentane phosphatase [Oesophagostomum dentatum]
MAFSVGSITIAVLPWLQRKTITLVRDAKEECISDVTHNVRHWITIDKKVTPMKALQGLIWEEAYRKGNVKGHVYPDVLPALKSLSVPTYIYSSGSVLAQKLIFGHSIAGDLTKILSGYFDTNIGLKGDPSSYRKICEQIGCSPSDISYSLWSRKDFGPLVFQRFVPSLLN